MVQNNNRTPAREASLQVKVVEARTKDVGRGLVRLDPADIEEMGAVVGDVVQITGQKKTVARLMPAFAAERGKRIIQMDGVLRSNSGPPWMKKFTFRALKQHLQNQSQFQDKRG